MLSPQLQQKIENSLRIIKRAEPLALQYQPYGLVVAFSGGKDSIVLADLVKRANVAHRLEYNLTTIDPPEVVRFIKTQHPECIINRPPRTFWQICEHHRILPSRKIRFCCQQLKERTGAGTVTLTGVRHAESARRAKRGEVEILTRRRHPEYVRGTFDQFDEHRTTEIHCIRGKDKLVVNPLLDWTEDDIWAYIHHHNLPYPEVYDRGYKRVGCLFCPMANEKRILREAKDYPKYYEAYLRMIARIQKSRRELGNNSPFENMTPEQVFHWMASKKSLEKFWGDLQQPTFDF